MLLFIGPKWFRYFLDHHRFLMIMSAIRNWRRQARRAGCIYPAYIGAAAMVFGDRSLLPMRSGASGVHPRCCPKRVQQEARLIWRFMLFLGLAGYYSSATGSVLAAAGYAGAAIFGSFCWLNIPLPHGRYAAWPDNPHQPVCHDAGLEMRITPRITVCLRCRFINWLH